MFGQEHYSLSHSGEKSKTAKLSPEGSASSWVTDTGHRPALQLGDLWIIMLEVFTASTTSLTISWKPHCVQIVNFLLF